MRKDPRARAPGSFFVSRIDAASIVMMMVVVMMVMMAVPVRHHDDHRPAPMAVMMMVVMVMELRELDVVVRRRGRPSFIDRL